MRSRCPANQTISAMSTAWPKSAGRNAKLRRETYVGTTAMSAAPRTDAPRRRASAHTSTSGTVVSAAAASFIAVISSS